MTQQAVLRRDDISEFIAKMYEGDLHAKRVLSLSNATLGVLTSASLAIHAVGQGLAQAMAGQISSCVDAAGEWRVRGSRCGVGMGEGKIRVLSALAGGAMKGLGVLFGVSGRAGAAGCDEEPAQEAGQRFESGVGLSGWPVGECWRSF